MTILFRMLLGTTNPIFMAYPRSPAAFETWRIASSLGRYELKKPFRDAGLYQAGKFLS